MYRQISRGRGNRSSAVSTTVDADGRRYTSYRLTSDFPSSSSPDNIQDDEEPSHRPTDYYGTAHAVTHFTLGTFTPGDSSPISAYLNSHGVQALKEWSRGRRWTTGGIAAAENALRLIALHATPTPDDESKRLHLMEALRKLAESGINFCQGLTIEPYGSFTSGMWTRHGDLDISIEGSAEWLDEYSNGSRNGGRGGYATREGYATTRQVGVLNMSQGEKKKFLKAFANKLRDRVASPQNFLVLIGEKIRVPIIKFVSKAGHVECDVSCDGHKALFKSTIMGLLSHHDWRFGTMVRLIKLWARKWELNDPTTGTFNSFCLSLMVLFYFQNRSPAIFPPLKELFAGEDRPMQDANGGGDNNNCPLEKGKMTRLVQLANDKLHQLSALKQHNNNNNNNSETLVELLSGFFTFYSGIFSAWLSPEDEYQTTTWKAYKLPNPETNRKLSQQLEEIGLARVARHARINTWDGSITTQPWPPTNGALFSIEDPFNSTDNCSRTIRRWDTAHSVVNAFRAAATQLQILTDTMDVVLCLDTLFSEADVDIQRIFNNGVQKRAVKAIQPVDLMLPKYVREVIGKTPPCIVADHTVARNKGGGREEEGEEEDKSWDAKRRVSVSNMSIELGAEIKEWAEGKIEMHRIQEGEREKNRRAKEEKRAKKKAEKDTRKAVAKAASAAASQAGQLAVAAAQMALHGNGGGGISGGGTTTVASSTTVVETLTVINSNGGRSVSSSSSSDEEMEEDESLQVHPKRLAFLQRQERREAAAMAAAAQAQSRVLAGRYHGHKKTNV